MHNMKSIISSYIRSVLNSSKVNYCCNCGDNIKCFLQNQSITPNIVYVPDVSKNPHNEKRVDLEVLEIPFKERYLCERLFELKRNSKVSITTRKIAKNIYGSPKHNFCRLSY